MRHPLITAPVAVAAIVAILDVAAAHRAIAAPPAPSADELCALALTNRPTEQLQERQGCTVVQSKTFAKGPMKRAAIVRVPLNDGAQDLLMIEVAADGKSAWQDLGPLAGESGGLGDLRASSTLESLEVRTTTGGPRLVGATLHRREMIEPRGRSIVTRHEWLVCGFERDLVCVNVADRVSLEVQGDIPDLQPYAWTRTVELDARGIIVVGALTGSGDAGPFDPGPGAHALASLADKPFVRLYPVTPNVHPDAVKDDLPLPP